MLLTAQVQMVVSDNSDANKLQEDLARALYIWGTVKKVQHIEMNGVRVEKNLPKKEVLCVK